MKRSVSTLDAVQLTEQSKGCNNVPGEQGEQRQQMNAASWHITLSHCALVNWSEINVCFTGRPLEQTLLAAFSPFPCCGRAAFVHVFLVKTVKIEPRYFSSYAMDKPLSSWCFLADGNLWRGTSRSEFYSGGDTLATAGPQKYFSHFRSEFGTIALHGRN